MNKIWQEIKSFWCAEEVPRWFGLTLVTAYVLGLGALAFASQRQMRYSALTHEAIANQNAVTFLAGLLQHAGNPLTTADESLLRRFALDHQCSNLRFYDQDRRILSSMSRPEIGQTVEPTALAPHVTPKQLVTYHIDDDLSPASSILLRAPVKGIGGAPTRYVEASFEVAAPSLLTHSFQVCALITGLVATTIFFLLYRRLRRHFHSVSSIARRLNESDQIENQLEQLRLHDAGDALAAGWNRLVELAVSLREEVDRSTAASELLAALDNNRRGELAEAMATVPLGIILAGEDGHIDYANAVASYLCGLDGDSGTGLSLENDNPSIAGPQIVDVLRSCVHEQKAMRSVERFITVSDDGFYHVQVVPVQTRQHVRRYVILIRDVSQQVRADKAREEFVSQVTHELRTPLTNIRAYAETLSSGMFEDPKVITDCYNVIMKETRRLSRLIEDILSISQLEAGTMELLIDTVNLHELLTDGVRDVRGIAESKNIDLQIDLPPKIGQMKLDRDKMAVVINNLLGNALKYTPAGGNVVLSCKTKGDEVQISVKDTGIGIDEKDHDRIFEKFQRSVDPDVQRQSGTGIGLTTALEIVRHHGGDITLHSKKGEGATFTVHLPTSQTPATGGANAAALGR